MSSCKEWPLRCSLRRQPLWCSLWLLKYFCTTPSKDWNVWYFSHTWKKKLCNKKQEDKIIFELPASNVFWWSNIPCSVSWDTPNPCSKWNYFAILNPQMSCLFLTDVGKLPREVNFLSVYSLFLKQKKQWSYKCHTVLLLWIKGFFSVE